MPAATRLRSGPVRPEISARSQIVVDSPPGMTANRERTGACLFQRAQVFGHVPLECQHPDHGRYVGARLPSASGVVLVGRERVDVDAHHGFA